MIPWYKNKVFIALCILAVLLGGALIVSGPKSEEEREEDEVAEVKEGEVEVKGEIACLPYRTPGPNQSCVKGMKGDDGKFYSLNSAEVRGIEDTMEEGTDVTAIGTYEPAAAGHAESSVFIYDGVLVLSSLKKQ